MPINNELAHEVWTRFCYVRDRGHIKFLEKAEKCDSYFAGDQWTESDLNMLRLQRRPALTVNKIMPTISTIMGEQIGNRAEVTFRPSTGGLPATAEALNKVWMQIAQNNQLNWVRSEVFADGVIRGRGFYDVRMDFSDAMQGEVRISQINSKNVIVDPDAEEYDPDSWNDVFVTKWMTPQDISILYSDEDAEYLKHSEGSAFPYGYDSIERVRDRFAGGYLQAAYYGVLEPYGLRRTVRVLDRQYRKLDKQLHFVDTMTGDMRPVPDSWDRNKIASVLERTGGRITTTKKLVKRIRWTVSADQVVLHDDWSPYKHMTVVPYFPHFRYGRTVGLVENLLGPQELLNKTISQELHVINTTANSGWMVKKGSLVNMSIEELEQHGAKTGLVMELDDISNVAKIQPNAMPTGLDRLSYKAEEAVKSVSGVSDSMQGFDREDVAAKAIAYKQQRGSVSMMKVQDNLERTDFILARNVLDLIQTFYTEERLIHITHSDALREPETISVNQQTPEGEIVNDLTIGEYSIIITSAPYRATMEDSQFEQALAMRQQGIQIPDSVLVENSRLQRKSEIIKQMEGDQNSPEAQAQKELAMRQAEATVAGLEADVATKHADAALKNVKAQKEAAEAQGGPDAQLALEQHKAEQEAALEREKMEREHAMALEKLQQDFTLKQQQLDQEMALKRDAHEQEMTIRRQAAQQQAMLSRMQALQQKQQAEEAEEAAEAQTPTSTKE